MILTPPDRVLSPTNVRRSFIPSKFWQIFKLSPAIIMGERNHAFLLQTMCFKTKADFT